MHRPFFLPFSRLFHAFNQTCHAVLRGIEDLKVKGFRPDQMQDKILSLVETHLKASTREDSARKDVASHFVLRLGYCLTEDKRRWFLAQECDLFRARFRALLPDEQRQFMETNALPFRTLTRDEFDQVREALVATALAVTNSLAAAQGVTQGASPHESFYKVPFEAVPDLVATRRVFLRGGFAYVSRDQVGSLVVQPFREALSKSMTRLARDWNSFMAREEADRLAPLVEGLSQRYLGPDYSDASQRGAVGGPVTAADIPRLSYESFPLCMATMTSALHEQHHLKHVGRMQLGLFLKGIGLPLEEAVRFWRTEMAQYAPGDKFDKQYLYNIRHNYGKEGKRADYTPHSCASIIGTTPGVGQVHGCPYRLFGEEALRAALTRLQVPSNKLEEAVGKAKAGHFQLACAAVWEGKMGCSCDTGINHPNQYYEESRKVVLGNIGAPANVDGTEGGDVVMRGAGNGNDMEAPAGKIQRVE
jgi:DNA primase large subunit